MYREIKLITLTQAQKYGWKMEEVIYIKVFVYIFKK